MEKEVTYVMLLIQGDSKGSSVDPEVKVESMEVQQSGSGHDSSAKQTSDADKGNKDDSKDKKESKSAAVPPPEKWWSSDAITHLF